MSLIEAAFFYNSFSDLFAEVNAAELCENVEAKSAHEEICTCVESSNAL
jgi:hypothetical protein